MGSMTDGGGNQTKKTFTYFYDAGDANFYYVNYAPPFLCFT